MNSPISEEDRERLVWQAQKDFNMELRKYQCTGEKSINYLIEKLNLRSRKLGVDPGLYLIRDYESSKLTIRCKFQCCDYSYTINEVTNEGYFK